MNASKPLLVQRSARLAGAFYLLIIVAGIFGQIVVRGSLVVPGDPAATAAHIEASASLWRWGIVGDVLMQLCDIPVMVLLYHLFRAVNPVVALTALGFNIIQTVVLVVNKLALVIPLLLLGSPSMASAFSAQQISSQVALWVEVYGYGFSLGLVFFGAACLLYGYLLFRSTFFPRVLGVLVAMAGLSYLISSFSLLLAPEASSSVAPVLVISLVGELSFTLWLLLRGLDPAAWEKVHLARRELDGSRFERVSS